MASKMLQSYGYGTVLMGIKKGQIGGQEIIDIRLRVTITGIHTITLYMNARNQESYEDYILNLKPSRIIFNPGAENYQLAQKASDEGIEVEFGCTLVMLRTGQY